MVERVSRGQENQTQRLPGSVNLNRPLQIQRQRRQRRAGETPALQSAKAPIPQFETGVTARLEPERAGFRA